MANWLMDTLKNDMLCIGNRLVGCGMQGGVRGNTKICNSIWCMPQHEKNYISVLKQMFDQAPSVDANKVACKAVADINHV